MILVTGGTGYIGSHTVVELIEKGFAPLIVDNLSNSNIEVLDGIEEITGIRPLFEKADVADSSELENVFIKYPNIKAVIHFAAYKAVGESVQNPLKYYSNNLFSLINLLDMMKKHKVHHIVFSSSCTVYGEPDFLPVDENAPIKKANSPYGNTKQIAEEIIFDTISSDNDLSAISLRYFNPIGAHPSALIGELPLGVPDNLVPYITQTAIGLRKELRVFGNDYDTPDGTCVRDYIHVVDLAKAHIVAIERLTSKKNAEQFEVFNLGTGIGNTVLDVIQTFENANNIKLNYNITDRRPGDVEKVFADPKKANAVLNWKAERSLSDALKSAWEWEKKYRNKK